MYYEPDIAYKASIQTKLKQNGDNVRKDSRPDSTVESEIQITIIKTPVKWGEDSSTIAAFPETDIQTKMGFKTSVVTSSEGA